MPLKKTQPDPVGAEKLVAEARRNQQLREQTYREQALKILPPVCARCAREFEGKRLRELTVHHKDHNHDNNPRDGSNWELLCLFCHDNEHSRNLFADEQDQTLSGGEREAPVTYRPFAALEDLLKKEK